MFVERCDRLSQLSLFDLNEMEPILELLAKQTPIMHITHAIRNLAQCFVDLKTLKRIEKKSNFRIISTARNFEIGFLRSLNFKLIKFL